MGQKVNPHGLRLGVINGWETQWFANKKDFSAYLYEDYKLRDFIMRKYKNTGIGRVVIERPQGKINVYIHAARTGMIIGQKHAGIDELRKSLSKIVGDKPIFVNVIELKHIDINAKLVAEGIAVQLEKRASFRRTMKQSMSKVMHGGAKGVKIMVSGRLDGAEIARSEHYHDGSIPLQTLRANIDYGTAEAHTTFGVIGIKVWIFKGEVHGAKEQGEK